MKRAYEFYRVLVFIGGGSLLIMVNVPILTGVGAGMIGMGVVLHMTTICKWTMEDIRAAEKANEKGVDTK